MNFNVFIDKKDNINVNIITKKDIKSKNKMFSNNENCKNSIINDNNASQRDEKIKKRQ
jgi:hypothetical protein